MLQRRLRRDEGAAHVDVNQAVQLLQRGLLEPFGNSRAGIVHKDVEPTKCRHGLFDRGFDGAGISQYKLANFRGKTRLLVTTNTEEAVLNALSAAARALSDPSSRGVPTTIQIVMTTSSGEPAGTVEMSPEQSRLLVNGQISAADFFVRNVEL